jgi:hypothetical protein
LSSTDYETTHHLDYGEQPFFLSKTFFANYAGRLSEPYWKIDIHEHWEICLTCTHRQHSASQCPISI